MQSDGTVDPGFDSTGSIGKRVATQPDGKFVASATAYTMIGSNSWYTYQCMVRRYNNDGKADTYFAGGPWYTLNPSASSAGCQPADVLVLQ